MFDVFFYLTVCSVIAVCILIAARIISC